MCGILIASNLQLDLSMELMTALEKNRGGNGNGFVIVRKGKVKKGVNLKINDIYRELKRYPRSMFIFHTRMASYGKIMDELCQPFKIPGGYVVHNGTWIDFVIDYLIKEKRIPDYANDSFTLAYLVSRFGPEILREIYGAGVVIYYNSRKRLVYLKNEGSLFYNDQYKCIMSYHYGIISAKEIESGYQVFGFGKEPKYKKENKNDLGYLYYSRRRYDYSIKGFDLEDEIRGNNLDIGFDDNSNQVFPGF